MKSLGLSELVLDTGLSVTPLMGHLVFLESHWSVHVNQRVCMSFLIGVVLFEGESTLLRNASILMDCLDSRQEKIGQHFPINRFKFGHVPSIYIAVWPKYLHSSSLTANKSSSVDLKQLAVA